MDLGLASVAQAVLLVAGLPPVGVGQYRIAPRRIFRPGDGFPSPRLKSPEWPGDKFHQSLTKASPSFGQRLSGFRNRPIVRGGAFRWQGSPSCANGRVSLGHEPRGFGNKRHGVPRQDPGAFQTAGSRQYAKDLCADVRAARGPKDYWGMTSIAGLTAGTPPRH